MIYTIGYQYLTPAQLALAADRLGAIVIDCRSRPSGRVKRGFSRADLTALLGDHYEWRGDALGGLPSRDVLADPRKLMARARAIKNV